MTRHHTTGRDRWANPPAYTDPSLRRLHYGPIQTGEPRSLLARIFWRK